MKSIILLGGGLDSTYLLARLATHRVPLNALFFNYGQKAVEGELRSCSYFCNKYNVPLKVVKVDIGSLANCAILKGNSVSVHANKNVLEGRNAIFISMAVTYACTIGAKWIYTGFHKEPVGSKFEDAKQTFVDAFNNYVDSYLQDKYKGIRLTCPFSDMSREDILVSYHAVDPEVISKSWTCYEGGKEQCGVCVHCKKKMKMMKKLRIK